MRQLHSHARLINGDSKMIMGLLYGSKQVQLVSPGFGDWSPATISISVFSNHIYLGYNSRECPVFAHRVRYTSVGDIFCEKRIGGYCLLINLESIVQPIFIFKLMASNLSIWKCNRDERDESNICRRTVPLIKYLSEGAVTNAIMFPDIPQHFLPVRAHHFKLL